MNEACHLARMIRGECVTCGDAVSNLHMPMRIHGWYCAQHCPVCNHWRLAAARILVVDDQRLVLDMVSSTLLRGGYEVLCADGANQALEIVKREGPIDVVLSQFEMPAMRSTDLLRQISRMSPHTASVLMSGGKAATAKVPPGVPLIRKPFSTSELISTVEAVVARAAQARAQLSRELEKSAVLRRRTSELASQLNRAVRDAEKTLRKIHEAREGRQRHPGEK